MSRYTVIYLLPGWTGSKGACLEFSIAKALGMEVIEGTQHVHAASSAVPAVGTPQEALQ